jgi:hypothetical protein
MNDEKVDYYAIVGIGRTPTDPSGLVRRRYTVEGRVDEALRKDFTWQRDTAIIEWEYGNLAGELVKISAAEAEELVKRIREKWGTQA